MPHQPSVYLGAFETTVAELTSAYTVCFPILESGATLPLERIDDAAARCFPCRPLSRAAIDPG